jgi:hypothetical protein
LSLAAVAGVLARMTIQVVAVVLVVIGLAPGLQVEGQALKQH